MSRQLYIALIGMLLLSCTKQLNEKEYAQYVSNPENGLRKDQVVGDFELSAMYEPVEYILSLEQPGDIETRRNELNEYEHFQFRIKLNTGGNILMHNETSEHNEVTRINHFSFMCHQDFMIISDADTSKCVGAIYSRNYNLTPTIDLSLAFNQLEKDENWQLIYTDQQFNLGRTKFLFKKEYLSDLPEFKK
ncbi:MAG: hypothetical protein HUJ25_11790 [Crocinitomicaceae bacterium]|nr:hypothetical protein [Crocinitomicaceae bacterium]